MDADDEQQHEEQQPDAKKPRLSSPSSPETATDEAAVHYRVPTKAERDEIVQILSQPGGFDMLFRPDAISDSGGAGQGKAASYYSDRYVNIPEEDKWWKDDDKLFLQSSATPADVLKYVSRRLQLNHAFIFNLIPLRWDILIRDDIALPINDRRYEPVTTTIGSSLSDAIVSVLGHADSAVFDDWKFFEDYYDTFSEYHGDASSSELVDAEKFLCTRLGPKLKDNLPFIRFMIMRARQHTVHTLFENTSDRLRDNPDFILYSIAARSEPTMCEGAIRHASLRLRDDPVFMVQAQEKLSYCIDSRCPYRCVLESASERLRDDEGFVLRIFHVMDAVRLDLVSHRLQNDKAFILKVIERSGDGICLKSLPEKFRDDADVVSQCIHQWSESLLDRRSQPDPVEPRHRRSPLRFASDRIRDNLDVVKQAIQYDPIALWDASERLMCNKGLVIRALQSLRDCSWDVRKVDISNDDDSVDQVAAVSTERKVFIHIQTISFDTTWWKDLDFIRNVLRVYPFVVDRILPVHLEKIDELPELVSVALGHIDTSGSDKFRDFWLKRFGRDCYREELLNFWTSSRLCFEMHCQIHQLASRLALVGGPGWDLLMPFFYRRQGRHRRFDGFTTAGFSVDDLKYRMYERIWLVDRLFASCGCDKSTAPATSEKSDKLKTYILKHIVSFAGIDGILRESNDLRKFEPLFRTLLKRNLVVPDDDD